MIRRALPGALLTLFFLGIYADPLLTRRNFAGRDLVAYNLPMEAAVHDAYARGRLPVWMAEVSGGRPLLANPNAGALYPLRSILSLLPFPVAMRIFPVFHWVLAALGTLGFLRGRGVSVSGAWIGAITYVFSGVAVSEAFFPHVLPGLALLPWILGAVSRGWKSEGSRVLALSALLSLEILAGDIFSTALALLAAALWILFEEAAALRAPRLVALAAAVALAIVAAAPQIVATALWIPESTRSVSGVKLGDALLFSISPLRLAELIVPYPFGSTFALDTSQVWTRAVFHGKALGLFATLYAGAFAVVAAAGMWRQKPSGARFARALLIVALSATILPTLLPSSWRSWTSPLPLRNPEKLAVGTAFALSILSGLAFDRFRAFPPRRRPLLGIAGALCAISLAARLWPAAAGRMALALTGEPQGFVSLAGRKIGLAFAEGGLLWVFTLLALEALGRHSRTGPGIAAVLLTLIPVFANRRIAASFPEEAIFAPTPFARFLVREDPRGDYRTVGLSLYRGPSDIERVHASNDPGRLEFARRNWVDYTPALWKRGMVLNGDFDAGDLSRLESLRRLSYAAASYRDSQNFWGALALRWAIRFRDQPPLPGYHRVGGDALTDWDEHEGADPDIRILTRWREEAGAAQALATFRRLGRGEAVIESGVQRQGASRAGLLRILEKSPERLLLEAESPDPTWLFALRAFWTQRSVLVDGAPAEVVPAQLAFSAVPLPAGRHRIEWKEPVPGGTASRFGPLIFLLLAAGWFLYAGASRRRA